MKPKRSLLLRLVAGQLLVVIVFSLIAMGNVVWQITRNGAGDYDQEMTNLVSAVLVKLDEKSASPEILQRYLEVMGDLMRSASPTSDAGKSRSQINAEVVLRVTDKSGQEIYRTPGHSHVPLIQLPLGSSGFSVGKQHWRAHSVQNKDQSLTLQLAQTSDALDEGLCDTIGRFILWPLFLYLPIAGLMTWFASARGLSPLRELADLVSHRSPVDLKPLEHVAAYAETEPLVNEINSLLLKLNTTLTRERNFLADAAHELRTPLAVIQAQAHVLRHAATEAEKNVATKELNMGIGRAASLIQKLLLTARVSVEDFVPRFEPVDLTAFVQERIATFSLLAVEKKIEMELQAPPHCIVAIDRETFVSAVDNVLDNAIRYTPEGGAIAISIALLAESKVSLCIADNGTGISRELYERVFERFFRVAGSEQQGSGLGLAIVKRVLALHGGDVALSTGLNQRGLGVNFTMPTAG
jgi:signal transduction histidine kinase